MAKDTPESQDFDEAEATEATEATEETSDVEESSETLERPKLQPFPAAMYRLAVFAVLALAGRCSYDIYKNHRNPDGRSAEEITRVLLPVRFKLNGDKSVPSEAQIKAMANDALCLLNKMGNPNGDAYTGADKKEHKRETTDSYIYDPKPGRIKSNKYLYGSNTSSYTLDSRIDNTVASIKQQKSDPDLKETMEWFTWEPDEFLKMPLACVRDSNNDCIKTWEGTDCLMVAPLAEAATRADLEMERAGKGKLNPIVCFRNNLHQAAEFVMITGKGCKTEGQRDGLMLPGDSHHGMGLVAMDLANQEQASEYLAKVGISCGFIAGDKGHCSFGEKSMAGFLSKWKLKWGKAKDLLRTGKDLWNLRKK